MYGSMAHCSSLYHNEWVSFMLLLEVQQAEQIRGQYQTTTNCALLAILSQTATVTKLPSSEWITKWFHGKWIGNNYTHSMAYVFTCYRCLGRHWTCEILSVSVYIFQILRIVGDTVNEMKCPSGEPNPGLWHDKSTPLTVVYLQPPCIWTTDINLAEIWWANREWFKMIWYRPNLFCFI